jgi:hypothetical protein
LIEDKARANSVFVLAGAAFNVIAMLAIAFSVGPGIVECARQTQLNRAAIEANREATKPSARTGNG